MKISIADRNSDADALAGLFHRNLTASYISHQELQSHRALAPDQWAPDIAEQLRDEIRERLGEPRAAFPAAGDWLGAVEAHDGATLVGVGLIAISRSAAVPFGVIEDIVVEREVRGGGRGEQMMVWILDQFRRCGLTRAFLESGIHNERAHHLFERLGFAPISTVMMKQLD